MSDTDPTAGTDRSEPDQPAQDEPPTQHGQEPEAPPAPLLTLADGLPDVTDTPRALATACASLAAGTGPVAIDAERASGYRYSQRAYLVQLRREGSTTVLVDPIAFDDLSPLTEALAGTEWVLHAATQDLPCLAEIGLHPDELFDTELAGRLLGYPRVGLATLVEVVLGWRMKKEHSAADWSTRPLPEAWLEYAALDVEVLVELRDRLAEELEAAGKAEWARQEFAALKSFAPTPRVDPWRRTSQMHRVRGRRGLGAVRALWLTRDEIAAQRDVTPGRVLPDTAIVAAASAMPLDKATLMATKGFHGRGADRYAARWLAALQEAAALPEDDLPARAPRGDGPPVPRAWAERDPVAAVRLQLARDSLAQLCEQHQVPVENLLTPDLLRRTLWTPPRTRDPGELLDAVVDQLADGGARGWQIALVGPVVVAAVLRADSEPDQPRQPGAPADQSPADQSPAESSGSADSDGSGSGT